MFFFLFGFVFFAAFGLAPFANGEVDAGAGAGADAGKYQAISLLQNDLSFS